MATARLKDKYLKQVVPELISEFGYANIMQVPRVTKVTLNMGVGEAAQDAKRDFQVIGRTRQGADHPVALNFPEGLYLKGVIMRSMS